MGASARLYDTLIWLLGWPLIVYVITIGVISTIVLSFIQLRYFFTCWSYALVSDDKSNDAKGDMSPLQAFINTLSANLGNGSIAGMATALYAGGPGAAFWVVLIGLLLMPVRFAEVYLSTYFGARERTSSGLGGPMLYLQHVPGGSMLAWLYGFSCLLFGLLVSNAVQANTVRLSLQSTWGVPMYATAVIVALFVFYVVSGGAQRIAKISEKLVPLKVGLFFSSSITVLIYHYQMLLPALSLIIKGAFSPIALSGGMLGFTVQQAMRFGMSRSIMATESGLGTAAILFGATGSKEPVRDGILSMLSTLISTIVCFMIALSIIASGVLDSGLNSSALTIEAFNTVFGQFGGWVVSFLSVSFGIGVMVAFAYIARQSWLFVTGGRYSFLFNIVFTVVSFIGAITAVDTIWLASEAINAVMLMINLFGILCLLPVIRRGVRQFEQRG